MREGEMVIQQGDKGDSFYVVLSGTFEVLLEPGPAAHPASPQRVRSSARAIARRHPILDPTPAPYPPPTHPSHCHCNVSVPLRRPRPHYPPPPPHPYPQSHSDVPVHTYSTVTLGFGELGLLYLTRGAQRG